MLTLEDLLSITPNAFIRVFASAANSYSGSRRLFKSKDYRLTDVVFGKFERHSLALLSYDKPEEGDNDYFRSNNENTA